MSSRVGHIPFTGCFNFRDLGGRRARDSLTVRAGRLYRADSVHLMTPEDAERARGALGIRTLLDLRSEAEVAAGGRGLLAEAGLRRLHLAFSGRGNAPAVVDASTAMAPSADRSPEAMSANYLNILELSSGLVLHAVRAITADDALPAVFFCAAGKDRTGVLAAVILGALGVGDEDVVADYVASGDAIVQIIGRLGASPGSPAMYRELPPEHFAPYARTMWTVIDRVRTGYGSFDGYLRSKGLSDRELETLRAALLE